MENENNFELSNMENLRNNESIQKNSPIVKLPTPLIMIPSLSLCKIDNSIDKIGTGFFIKFFKGDDDFFCLLTNEHIITSKLINEKKTITLYYYYQTKCKSITLNPNKRYIKEFTQIGIDATIVQILPEDNIELNLFLLPALEYMNSFQELLNKEITIIQYPLAQDLCYANGILKKIKKFEFTHFASTQPCSSGSPVFLKDSTKVIGVHKASKKDNSENYGDFIGPIFNFIKNNFKFNIIKLDNGECYYGGLENNIKNGKGILYYANGAIKYDGFFINDKFEGYGKYIDKNGQYFIGEWKNDLRYKGKEYINGDLIFEGEYLNGKKWNGNGREEWWNGNILFEGQFKEGMRSKGKEYNFHGEKIFEGEYLNGKRWNGKGIEVWDDKVLFEGEYVNGKQWNGRVMDYFIHLRYRGQILNGKKHGHWVNCWDDGAKFEGEYLNGKENGKCIYYNSNGWTSECEYLDGKKNGRRKEYNSDHYLIYESEYLNDKINGKYKKYYENGNLKFECEYLNGERKKEGKEYDENGNLKFEGEYLNGERNGKGKEYYKNGEIILKGEYIKGLRNGKFTKYNTNGKILFEGEYLNGENIKGMEYFDNGKIMFEGKYLYDNRWDGKGFNYEGVYEYEIKKGNGKVKYYNFNGELIFEGEIINGIKYNKNGIKIKDSSNSSSDDEDEERAS